jgi:hypothetical protein
MVTLRSLAADTVIFEPDSPRHSKHKWIARLGGALVSSRECICLSVLLVPIAIGVIAVAQSSQVVPAQVPQPMERQQEINLALSACPSSVSGAAAVYVLEKSGYVRVRDSENGFTAIVQHAMLTSQEPQCIDAEGTRTFLPRILLVAELRAQGKSGEEIKRLVADAIAKGTFHPPTRPGITYMLSKENIVPNETGIPTPFPPHVMFYGPYMTNADIGADRSQNGPAFVATEGSPYALIIVPVGTHKGPSHASAEKASPDPR